MQTSSSRLCALLFLALVLPAAYGAEESMEDPWLWLEEVDGEKALAWV